MLSPVMSLRSKTKQTAGEKVHSRNGALIRAASSRGTCSAAGRPTWAHGRLVRSVRVSARLNTAPHRRERGS